MNPLPPPPPPRPDLSAWQGHGSLPVPGRSVRPPLVTAAGIILVVLGALQALGGIALMAMSVAELVLIPGVGAGKLAKYGEDVLQITSG